MLKLKHTLSSRTRWALQLACAVAMCSALSVSGQQPGRDVARSTSPVAKGNCASLTTLKFEGNTTITSATAVPAGSLAISEEQVLNGLPAFCRVIGVSKPTSDSNINF